MVTSIGYVEISSTINYDASWISNIDTDTIYSKAAKYSIKYQVAIVYFNIICKIIGNVKLTIAMPSNVTGEGKTPKTRLGIQCRVKCSDAVGDGIR